MDDKYFTFILVGVIIFILLIFIGIHDLLREIQVDAMCRVLGWPGGDFTLLDGMRCIQTLECSIDEITMECTK